MIPIDPAARPGRSEYDVHLEANVMVPMRDGVRMATDVYRPARDGRPVEEPRPVLLLYPTSNLFMPGHRIRLDVSSSNHPRFDVNPNTGEPLGRDRRRAVADNTVFHERGRASKVVLPVIPVAPGGGR